MKHTLALTLLLALTSAPALAHSEKESMTPANGAVLDSVPETIELRFDDKMRLTKVGMTHAETHTEPLDLGAQSGFAQDFSLPLTSMGPGVYQIEWRGLGIDGHAMNGAFSFEVK